MVIEYDDDDVECKQDDEYDEKMNQLVEIAKWLRDHNDVMIQHRDSIIVAVNRNMQDGMTACVSGDGEMLAKMLGVMLMQLENEVEEHEHGMDRQQYS